MKKLTRFLILHILRVLIFLVLILPIIYLWETIETEKDLCFAFLMTWIYGSLPLAYIFHFIELYWRKAKRYKIVISLVKVGK